MREHDDLIRAWRAMSPGMEAVLATVVATRGSVYRRPGARMLLTPEGWVAGSISGGCIESDLVQTAFSRTEVGPVVVTYDASAPDDVLLGFGLGCNGAVDVLMQRLPEDGGPLRVIERVVSERREARLETFANGSWTADAPPLQVARLGEGAGGRGEIGLAPPPTPSSFSSRSSSSSIDAAPPRKNEDGAVLVETLSPPPALVIFGAGHDAVPLVRVAKEVGWHVTVVDGRAAYARADRFPEADVVRVSPPGRKIEIEEGAAVVLMTHSFAHDAAILGWLPESLAYVGVLGPIHRTKRLLDEIGIDGDRLHAPIGLDLGADGPNEIALAIVAEILAVRKDRSAGPLKGRMTPLHEKDHVGRL